MQSNKRISISRRAAYFHNPWLFAFLFAFLFIHLFFFRFSALKVEFQRIQIKANTNTKLISNYTRCLLSSNSPYKFDYHFDPVLSPTNPDKIKHYHELTEHTLKFRSIVSHGWMGYGGPWIESVWIEEFCCNRSLEDFGPFIPLFIQWVDIKYDQRRKEKPYAEFVKPIFDMLRPEYMYVTVAHDSAGVGGSDFHLATVPPNLFIFSPTGRGHVMLPHMIRELRWRGPGEFQRKGIFLGNYRSHKTRPITARIAKKKWGYAFKTSSKTQNWVDDYRHTKFIFSPRGWARTCYRTYEILQLGLIPVIIANDVNLIPYQNTTIDWSNLVILTDTHHLRETMDKLDTMEDEKYKKMLRTIKESRKYFTYKGIIEQIGLFMKSPEKSLLRCSEFVFDLN